MKTIHIIFVLLLIFTNTPTKSVQAAVIYNSTVPIKKNTFSAKKKKVKKRFKPKLNRNNIKTKEGKKALTYILLAITATLVVLGLILLSLAFMFSIPIGLGIFLAILTGLFHIASIVFWINGIIYLNKAKKMKQVS